MRQQVCRNRNRVLPLGVVGLLSGAAMGLLTPTSVGQAQAGGSSATAEAPATPGSSSGAASSPVSAPVSAPPAAPGADGSGASETSVEGGGTVTSDPGAAPPPADAPAPPVVSEAIRRLTHRIELRQVPDLPVLGRDKEIQLTFLVTDDQGAPAATADLKISTLVGSLGTMTHEGGGRFTISYFPPDFQAPTVAILTVQSTLGDAVFVPLPLIGVNRLPVQSLPDLPVRFEVAGKVFGPFDADGKGIAQAVIEVPPGVTQARVVSARPGTHLEEQVALKPPPFSRIRFMPVGVLKADGRAQTTVHIGVISPAGVLSGAGKLQLRAQVGAVTTPVQQPDGTWMATYTAPRSSTLAADRVTAILGEEGVEQTQVLEVDLIPQSVATGSEGGIRQSSGEKLPDKLPVIPPTPGVSASGSGGKAPGPAATGDPARAGAPGPAGAGSVPPPSKPVSTGKTVTEVVELPSARSGLKVMTFLGAGVYAFTQTPESPQTLMPAVPVTLQAATLAAPGLGLEGWFNPFLGFALRYQGAFYTFAMPELEEGAAQGDVKHLLEVEGRARLPLELGGMPLSVGAGVGVSVQDHPAFELAQDGGYRFQYDLLLPVLQPGLELWVYPTPNLTGWVKGGLGLHVPRFGQVTARAEAGVLFQLKPRLGLGLGVALWQRHLTASSQGTVLASLEDTWIQGLGFLAWSL